MKDEIQNVTRLASISEIHRTLGLTDPAHSSISLIDATEKPVDMGLLPDRYVLDVYKISFITKLGGTFRYGQGYYDFDEGSLLFTAPNQVIGGKESYLNNRGYSLLIHPDFIHGYALTDKINRYRYFAYDVDEALHLSETEKITLVSIFAIIKNELSARIDAFSHDVLIAQIELLLSYAKRFYSRQFITRQATTLDVLEQLENLLNSYFEGANPLTRGLPTVRYLADQLNYTPNYLSDMLRSLTGLNAQQHIHRKLIERSKELLSTTNLTVSEIACVLGFDHSQSFSRLFKSKTQQSPMQFRSTFT